LRIIRKFVFKIDDCILMDVSQKNILLNFVFYYNQNQWGFFLKKHLAHLIKLILEIDKNAEYIIYLSRYRGENIQLNVLAKSSARLPIIDLISQKTNIFFKKFPSAKKRVRYPLNGFFKDFPVNSIQYNLKSNSLNNSFSQLTAFNADPHKILNKIIFSCLTKKEINEETIFLVNYYLHVALVKVLLSTYQWNGKAVLEEIVQKIKSPDEVQEKWSKQLLNENESILTAIIRDIFEKKILPTRKGYLWIPEWIEFCDLFFETSAPTKDKSSVYHKLECLISIINSQLAFGFKGMQFFFIQFIIDKSLPMLNQKKC